MWFLFTRTVWLYHSIHVTHPVSLNILIWACWKPKGLIHKMWMRTLNESIHYIPLDGVTLIAHLYPSMVVLRKYWLKVQAGKAALVRGWVMCRQLKMLNKVFLYIKTWLKILMNPGSSCSSVHGTSPGYLSIAVLLLHLLQLGAKTIWGKYWIEI